MLAILNLKKTGSDFEKPSKSRVDWLWESGVGKTWSEQLSKPQTLPPSPAPFSCSKKIRGEY